MYNILRRESMDIMPDFSCGIMTVFVAKLPKHLFKTGAFGQSRQKTMPHAIKTMIELPGSL